MEGVKILHSLPKVPVTCNFSSALARDCIRFGTSPSRFCASLCTTLSLPPSRPSAGPLDPSHWKSPSNPFLTSKSRDHVPSPKLVSGFSGLFESSVEPLDSLALVSPSATRGGVVTSQVG